MSILTDNLKPCPFCGHEAGVGQGPDGYFVNCTWCSAATDHLTGQKYTEQEAIDLWNKRVKELI